MSRPLSHQADWHLVSPAKMCYNQDTGHQVWQMPTESVTQWQVSEELQNLQPNRWSDVLDSIGFLFGITSRAVRAKRPGVVSDRPVAD